jgi:hypothetical protein
VRTTLLLLLMTCTASLVQAQTTESKSSLSAVAGAGQTWDDEGSLGRGWLAGGSVDRTLIGGLRAQLSLEVLTHDRSEGFLLAEGSTMIAGVSLLQRLGRAKAQPYLFGGATTGHHSGSRTFGDVRSEESSTDVGWRAGVGLAIRAGSTYEIGPELRMNGFFIDSDSPPATLLSIAVRLTMRL